MIYVVLAIVIFGILAGFLPPTICWLVYDAAFIAAIASIILIILGQFTRNKNISTKIICIVMLVFFLLFSKELFIFVHNYSEVKKDLEKGQFANKYKILKVKKEHVESSKDLFECDYIFDIQLNDGMNIIYQTSYCRVDSFWTSYSVIDNYIDRYIPYYLDSYNKTNSTNLKFVEGDNLFEGYYISYHTDDINQLNQFIEYLFSQTPGISYVFTVYNEDINESFSVSSWNDEYKHILEKQSYGNY